MDKWEAEAFEEILSDHGDVYAFSGARGIPAILEKVGCDHVKTLAQAEAAFSVDDTKDPSAEASLMGGIPHEIMKKSEKDIHDARVQAKQAEEAAERERRIVELSPPPEPFDPLADPEMKEALEIINMAESIVDEIVNKLLNQVAKKVLKEDYYLL